MINIYQEYPHRGLNITFLETGMSFFFRLLMSTLLITMKSCFLSLTTHILLGIWIFKMVEILLKIWYNQCMLTKSYQKWGQATKCFRKKKHPLSSWPWRIALSSPPSSLPTPSYLSSSGRFFIQLLSCKKVLLLLTSWKPCCLSVVPCVVVFISNNRKMKPQEIQCHGVECVFANLEILRGASDGPASIF